MPETGRAGPFAPPKLPGFITTTSRSAPALRVGTSTLMGASHLGSSLGIEAPGSHVPHESLHQARAAYLPVTVQPVNRLLLDLIPGCQIDLVSMTVQSLSTEHPRFTSVRLPGTCLTSHARRFPVRSPPGSLSPSSAGRLEGWSCNPPPEGLPPSSMQQDSRIWSTSLPPASAVMAHFGEAHVSACHSSRYLLDKDNAWGRKCSTFK